MIYSVLGGVKNDLAHIVGSATIGRIAAAHNVSAAEVAMRWVAQLGVPMVTLSSRREHQARMLGLFGDSWSLTDDEMDTLSALTEPSGSPSAWAMGACSDEEIDHDHAH